MTGSADGGLRQQLNILLVVTDQHRHDCLGVTSEGRVRTPNLDRLAGAGVRFDHAYTHLPICSPARASLLTGQRPETLGQLWNYDNGLPVVNLSPDADTWPRALHAAGYRTAYVGKWHVHPEHEPTRYGYDSYRGRVYDRERGYEAFRAEQHPGNSLPSEWFGEVDRVPLSDARSHRLASTAIEAMYELVDAGPPWHLRVDFPEPHLPPAPVREFADRYDAARIEPWGSFAEDLSGKPYIQRQMLRNWDVEDWDWADWAPVVARYFAVIEQTDDAIGLVLDELKAIGGDLNTVVVYTTDHGDM